MTDVRRWREKRNRFSSMVKKRSIEREFPRWSPSSQMTRKTNAKWTTTMLFVSSCRCSPVGNTRFRRTVELKWSEAKHLSDIRAAVERWRCVRVWPLRSNSSNDPEDRRDARIDVPLDFYFQQMVRIRSVFEQERRQFQMTVRTHQGESSGIVLIAGSMDICS